MHSDSIGRRKQVVARMSTLVKEAKQNPPNSTALQQIIAALDSPYHFERTTAAGSLGLVGPNAAPAADKLARLVHDESGYMRRAATISLGSLGCAAKPYIPVFIEAIERYRGSDVASFAASALADIADPDDPTVMSVLEAASRDTYYLARDVVDQARYQNRQLLKEQWEEMGYDTSNLGQNAAKRALEKLAARRARSSVAPHEQPEISAPPSSFKSDSELR